MIKREKVYPTCLMFYIKQDVKVLNCKNFCLIYMIANIAKSYYKQSKKKKINLIYLIFYIVNN